jgi:hypothetical protein
MHVNAKTQEPKQSERVKKPERLGSKKGWEAYVLLLGLMDGNSTSRYVTENYSLMLKNEIANSIPLNLHSCRFPHEQF